MAGASAEGKGKSGGDRRMGTAGSAAANMSRHKTVLAPGRRPWQCWAIMTMLNFYAGSGLDRAAHRRKDPSWLQAALPAARLVPYWRGKHLMAGPPEAATPVWLDPTADWWRQGLALDPIFLGLDGEVPVFAVDLSPLAEDPAQHAELAALGSFVDLRGLTPVLPAETAGVFAYARALMLWHDRHRFCGVCGHATTVIEAGHARRCTNPACGASHFPRTDPAVIMLVHADDRCLLGRQSRFPPGMYSTLAGFVEAGESLEEAVMRECLEEAGVHVGDVRYHSSQPWPFPSSLMLGFHARALSSDIATDLDELEDVRWVTRDFLLSHQPSDSFRLPPRDSISRRLIEAWLHEPASGR